MAALHLDNILFLLFVAIAIFFQILTRAATKARRRPGDPQRRSTSPSQRTRPLTQEQGESDEDQIRKFLEALGQPTTSTPPPPAPQRPTYQKPVVVPQVPRVLKSPLPPLTTRPPESEPDWRSPREIRLPGQIPPTHEAMIETPGEAYAIATAARIAQMPARKGDIALLLRSTSGLRQAIILREIFGPPRSMQPLDLVGSI